MNKYDAVVIGAGNGGLVAAIRLLQGGAKTLLVEKHNLPGGFATSFRRGRFEFEASLHELNDFGTADNAGDVRVLFDEYESTFIRKEDEIIIHIGVTPFTRENTAYRLNTFADLAQKSGKPVVTLNHVGGNGSLVFNGEALVFNGQGELCHRSKAFQEDFLLVDTRNLRPLPPEERQPGDDIAMIHDALLLGIKDFFKKNGFKRAVLGLSGGIDSAVVAVLATEALGKDNVLGILMPSEFSTDHSVKDALDLARNLGIQSETLPIKEIYDQFLSTLKPIFGDRPFDVAEENLQAKSRVMCRPEVTRQELMSRKGEIRKGKNTKRSQNPARKAESRNGLRK